MFGLEDEREGAFKFGEDRLDEFREGRTVAGLRVIDVLGEDSDCLRISLALELVSALLEDKTEGRGVRDDAVVDDGEVCLGVRLERVAVDDGRRAVCRPAGVRDGDLREEGLARVHVGLCDALAEPCDLADLFEEEHLAGAVAIDTYARGVVAPVLLSGEAPAEDLADGPAVLEDVKGVRHVCVVCFRG